MHPISSCPIQTRPGSSPPEPTLYASLELSRSTWLVTSLSPGSEKMSKHTLPGGDGAALLDLLSRLRAKAEQSAGRPIAIVIIQEAGLDGFWIHRLLGSHGTESHVVDPASIAVPRRRRRAKTDAIDGETLLRTLLAWKRGEPRVCAMVVPPTAEQEDRRRTSRERAILLQERVRHVNRIKGLLAGQGITDFEPVHKDRRTRLAELRTGDAQLFPARLNAELLREIELLELLERQIAVRIVDSQSVKSAEKMLWGRRREMGIIEAAKQPMECPMSQPDDLSRSLTAFDQDSSSAIDDAGDLQSAPHAAGA